MVISLNTMVVTNGKEDGPHFLMVLSWDTRQVSISILVTLATIDYQHSWQKEVNIFS